MGITSATEIILVIHDYVPSDFPTRTREKRSCFARLGFGWDEAVVRDGFEALKV